jgi:hypothetical protein
MPRSLNSNEDAYPWEDLGWGFDRLGLEHHLRVDTDEDEPNPGLNFDLDADSDPDDKSSCESANVDNPYGPAVQAAREKPQLSPWEVCYQVNLSFQRKITGPWQCVACSRTGFATSPEYRSDFVTAVAICPDGHKDHLSSSNATGKKIACGRCDEDYALRVSQETVKCFHPLCPRMLVVDWELVKGASEGEDWQDTLEQ